MIAIDRIDHFVMRVASIDATCAFYTRVLGMEVEHFGEEVPRVALRFGRQKINLHPDDSDWIRARDATVGSDDFCLITETPMDQVVAHLTARDVAIEDGPRPRTGALGPLLSVYFRDPDGNLLEVSNYT